MSYELSTDHFVQGNYFMQTWQSMLDEIQAPSTRTLLAYLANCVLPMQLSAKSMSFVVGKSLIHG